MKRRTNRILSILLVVLSLALLAGAGFLLVQVLPQKAPQEVTSLETNSVFEKEDTLIDNAEPELVHDRFRPMREKFPRRRRRSPSPTRSHLSISPSRRSLPTRASFPPRRTSAQEQHLPL